MSQKIGKYSWRITGSARGASPPRGVICTHNDSGEYFQTVNHFILYVNLLKLT